MPIRLINAPAIFKAYMEHCLQPFIDDFAMCYLDDLLIYSTHEKAHEAQLQRVLERLREFGLYSKDEKCHIKVTEVVIPGFGLIRDEMGMEWDRMSTIEDWKTPESVGDVHVLLGFTNFYRQFIRKCAMVTTQISDLPKKAETSRTPKQLK
jgi:hypothetical protein